MPHLNVIHEFAPISPYVYLTRGPLHLSGRLGDRALTDGQQVPARKVQKMPLGEKPLIGVAPYVERLVRRRRGALEVSGGLGEGRLRGPR